MISGNPFTVSSNFRAMPMRTIGVDNSVSQLSDSYNCDVEVNALRLLRNADNQCVFPLDVFALS